MLKLPRALLDYCDRHDIPDNVWLGVSVELPLYFKRVDTLRQVRAAGPKFISAEPLLADLGTELDLSGISQIIAGGESGWHLRDAALRAWRGMTDPPTEKPMAIKGWTPRLDRIRLDAALARRLPGARRSLFLEAVGRDPPGLRQPHPRQLRVLGDNGTWHDRRRG
jgi:protein gp37